MADRKISAFRVMTAAQADPDDTIPIVDASLGNSADGNRRISLLTIQTLLGGTNASIENAVRAETARDDAALSAALSAASAALAQGYVTGAAANSGWYDTIALGRAAVADGATFGVVAGGSDALTRPTLYLRTSAGAQVEVVDVIGGGEIDNPGLALISIAGYIDASGNFAGAGNVDWAASDFLPVERMSVQRVNLVGAPTLMSVAFYRANKTLISGVSAASSLGRVSAWPAVPAGAVYVRLTRRVSGGYKQAFVYSQPANLVASQSGQSRLLSSGLALFTEPGYLDTSGNIAGAGGGYLTTDFIPVNAARVSSLRLSGHTSALSVAFYTSARAFISGTGAAANGDVVSVMPAIPANAAYMRFTMLSTVTWPQELLLVANVAAIVPQAAQGKLPVDLATLATISSHILPDGTQGVESTSWKSTDYIACKAGDVFEYSVFGHPNAGSVVFYDAARAFVSAIVGPGPSGSIVAGTATAAVDGYVRVTIGVAGQPSVPAWVTNWCLTDVAYGPALTGLLSEATDQEFSLDLLPAARKMALSSPQKGMLAGDSISSSTYPWYKAEMEALTGIDWYNGGFPGYSAAQLAADAALSRIWTYGGDLVIYMPGGNDTGAAGTVGTFGAIPGEPIVAETDINADYAGTTFIQAVSHVARKFRNQYENIRARADLTGSETEAEKAAKIAAVLKPVLVLATTLPMRRTSAASPYSQRENQVRKRNAIVEVANRYNVPCVDLFSLVGWNMELEPWANTGDSTTINNGNRTMDGLHPNQFGCRDMAEIICGQLGL